MLDKEDSHRNANINEIKLKAKENEEILHKMKSILVVENNKDLVSKIDALVYNNRIYVKFVDKLIKLI